MSREQIYNSLILKKQAFGEADEIVTLYTWELGKLRVLAKSLKAAKSKLQHALQSLFLVEVRVAGSKGISKVIGAEVKNTFSGIRTSLDAAKYALYAAELGLKFSPDEQKNEELFNLLVEFFAFLDKDSENLTVLPLGLVKFKIKLLETVGLSLPAEAITSPMLKQAFVQIGSSEFRNLMEHQLNPTDLTALQKLLSEFIRHQLEREVKAEGLMDL